MAKKSSLWWNMPSLLFKREIWKLYFYFAFMPLGPLPKTLPIFGKLTGKRVLIFNWNLPKTKYKKLISYLACLQKFEGFFSRLPRVVPPPKARKICIYDSSCWKDFKHQYKASALKLLFSVNVCLCLFCWNLKYQHYQCFKRGYWFANSSNISWLSLDIS